MVDHAQAASELQPATGRLLCVDDDPHVLSALRRLFERQAYRVLEANSGAAALALLERETVDIVISDMRMPEMNGARFLEEVRMRWPDSVRILLTGHADVESTIAAVNQGGVSHCLTKPWNEGEFLRVVRLAFEGRRREAERSGREARIRSRYEALRTLNRQLASQVKEGTAALQKALDDVLTVKDAERRADYLAHHDALTGLPNRLLLGLRLQHAMAQAERRQASLAVLFIDLDHFKAVNDCLGHAAGDTLLQDAAGAMQAVLRQQDTLARFGGDEFIALIEGIDGDAAALTVAAKVLAVFPRQIGDIAVSASIGMSFYPRDGDSVAQLIEAADAAMYQGKAGGRADLRVFRH